MVVENTGFNRRCPKFRKADKVLGLEQLVSELQVLDGLLGVAGIDSSPVDHSEIISDSSLLTFSTSKLIMIFTGW